MKKLLSFILIAILCLSVFTGCAAVDTVKGWLGFGDENPDVEPNITYDVNAAAEYVHTDHMTKVGSVTASDYTVPAQVFVAGVKYTVDWTVDNELVKLTKGETTWTVDVNEKAEAEHSYKLTATVKAGDGTTKNVSFDHTVPEYKVITFEQYMAAKKGDVVTIEGIVVAINAVSNNNKYNHLYLADAEGKGGYYCYKVKEDPAKAGIKVGMTVSGTGTVEPYSGMQEIKDGVVTIVDKNIKTVETVDLTQKFAAGESLVNYVALPATIKGVTIGVQDMSKDTSQYLYFELNGHKGYVRTYVSDFINLPISVDDNGVYTSEAKTTIDAAHAAKFGWTANVSGILVLYGVDNPYFIPTSVDCFEYLEYVEKTAEEKIATEIEYLTITNKVEENTTIALPLVGQYYDEVSISWAVDNENYTIGEDGKLAIALTDEKVTLTLTATYTCDGKTNTKTYTVEVKALSKDLYVPVVATPAVGKAFKLVVFQNKLGETLYFAGTTTDKAYYLATTNDVNEAVDVYVEAVEGVDGGYRLYFYVGETKTYIRAYERTAGEAGKGSGSLELVTAIPTEYYTYDETLKTLVVTSADGLNKYYIGSYSTNNYISGSNTSYVTADNLGVSQFPANLATLAPAAYDTVVKAPEVDKAFKLVVFQNKLGETLYFAGTTTDKTYYLATTNDVNEAVDVYVEAVEGVDGGYRLYFYVGETKTYIRAYERTAGEAGKGSGSLELVTAIPTEYYTYDETLKTLVVTSADGLNKYYIGSYSTNNYISGSNTSYVTADNLGVSQFPANLATIGFVVDHVHDYATSTVTNPTCTAKGYTTHTCECGDSYTDTEVDATGHSISEGVCSTCNAKVSTIEEALAADDGVLVIVSGVVTTIVGEWSDQYGNMNVNITDENGNTIYLYRLSTKVALNDVITVTGKVGSHDNAKQIASGSTALITGTHTEHTYGDDNKCFCGATNPSTITTITTSAPITSVSQLTDGCKIVIAYGDYVLGASSGNIYGKVDVTANSDKSYSFASDAGVNVITVEANGDGTYALKAAEGYLLVVKGQNHLKYTDDKTNDLAKWTIEFVDGTLKIHLNDGSDERYLNYNASSPRFAAYKTSSNQKDVVVCIVP